MVPAPTFFQQEDPDVSVTYSSLNDELRTPFFRVYDFGDEPKRGSAPLATTENLLTPSGKTASELLGTFAGATPQKAAAIVDELHTTIAARPELTPAQRTQIDSILLDFRDDLINEITGRFSAVEYDIRLIIGRLGKLERALAESPATASRFIDLKKAVAETPQRAVENVIDLGLSTTVKAGIRAVADAIVLALIA